MGKILSKSYRIGLTPPRDRYFSLIMDLSSPRIPSPQKWNFSWRTKGLWNWAYPEYPLLPNPRLELLLCRGMVCGDYRCIPRGYRLVANVKVITKYRNFNLWSTFLWSLALMSLLLGSVYTERLRRLKLDTASSVANQIFSVIIITIETCWMSSYRTRSWDIHDWTKEKNGFLSQFRNDQYRQYHLRFLAI